MDKAKMSPPWDTYVKKIKALFEEDEEIRIEYNENNNVLNLYVDNTDKAEALNKLLPDKVVFGAVELKIVVIPANKKELSVSDLFKEAFKNNPKVENIVTVEGAFDNPMTYIAFEKKVIQYYSDNIGDLYGNTSTLLENIAREVFENKEGIFFCTDTSDFQKCEYTYSN